MFKLEKSLELCDHCFGRLYGKLGHGLTNKERGRALRIYYSLQKNMENKNDEEMHTPKNCFLCDNLFQNLENYSTEIIKTLSDYEFDTFLIGSRFDEDIAKKEEELREKYEYYEDIKSEFNRELGKIVSEKTNKEVEFSTPDIVVTMDTIYDNIELQIKSLYIYGRYNKLVRGISQTDWKEKGYEESVESLISEKIMQYTEGKSHKFHGMGREDTDVKMLGNGRPFVLEIIGPKKRSIDFQEMEQRINTFCEGKVMASDLRKSSKKEVSDIKESKSAKKYRIYLEMDGKTTSEELESVIETLKGKIIYQRTPLRTSHRRADKVRKKKVLDIKIESFDGKDAVLIIESEAGLYIKELIHGDDGRTKPSLKEMVKANVEIKALDVLEILT